MSKFHFFTFFVSVLFCLEVHSQAIGHTPEGNKEDMKSPTNLTDEEKIITETFVHEGLEQRKYLEMCGENASEEVQKACRGRNVDPKFMGMKSSMVKALAKAYTMIMGASGGSLEAGSRVKEGESQSDYCKWVAVGTESVAMVQQQIAQDSIRNTPTNSETRQKDLLYQAARSHEERAKQAKVQTGGWGITTACYGAMMVGQWASPTSWKNWLKLGSSALLTAFFANEASEHEKYADEVRKIADKLPGVGDCNPVTDKNCYCAQPETMNDPKYCLPEMHKRAVAENSFRVSCMDDKMKADPQCRCIGTDSCFDKKFQTNLEGLGFTEIGKGVFSSLKPLTRGELKGGNLKAAGFQQAAMARQTIKQLEKNIPSFNGSLNKDQANEAKAIQALGIPASLAKKMASTPFSSTARGNLARFNAKGNYSKGYKKKKKGNNVLEFGRGGSGLQGKKKAAKKNFNFMNRFKKKKKGSGKAKNDVWEFAQKAQEQAEIQKSDRPLFEIISHRYQRSGWRRLEYNQ